MDYKKKLKSRLYIAITYIALGIMMIAGTFVTKTDNDFISAFGFAMAIMGIVRIRNYLIITKNEERIRKQEIAETDERNLSIQSKAKSATFSIYTMLLGTAVIVLSFLKLHEVAKWISCSVLLLVAIYWICYLVYQKKS